MMKIRVNNDLGYTKDMSTLKGYKILETLNKLFRYDGIVMSRLELVIIAIIEGFIPKMDKNYTTYSSKIEGYTKPKTRYTLEKDGKGLTHMYVITKTQFDFANWLIENNIKTEDDVRRLESIEDSRIKTIEDEKNRIEQDEKDKIESLKEKQKNFDKWLEDETKKVIDNNDGRIALLREVYMSELGRFFTKAIELIVLIDNIDDTMCKKELICNRLHSGNKATKKAFSCITGIKLPDTNKGTSEVINGLSSRDFECKVPNAVNDVNSEISNIEDDKNDSEMFYIKTVDGYEEIEGVRIDNRYGLEVFCHKTVLGNYRLSHIPTGIAISDTITSDKEKLKDKIEEVVDINGGVDNILKAFNSAIEQEGFVPNFNKNEDKKGDINDMKSVKELVKAIKDIENDRNHTVLAYGEDCSLGGLYDSRNLISEECFICELELNKGFNKPYSVRTRDELQRLVELFANGFDDVLNVSHTVDRLDVYHKNGRKAIAVIIDENEGENAILRQDFNRLERIERAISGAFINILDLDWTVEHELKEINDWLGTDYSDLNDAIKGYESVLDGYQSLINRGFDCSVCLDMSKKTLARYSKMIEKLNTKMDKDEDKNEGILPISSIVSNLLSSDRNITRFKDGSLSMGNTFISIDEDDYNIYIYPVNRTSEKSCKTIQDVLTTNSIKFHIDDSKVVINLNNENMKTLRSLSK